MQKTTIECDGCGKVIGADSKHLVLESLRIIDGPHRSGNPGRQEACNPSCLKKLAEKIVREGTPNRSAAGSGSESGSESE